MPLTVLQSLVSGALIGGLYAAIAVGLTLIFGVVRIVNFAHGAFLMAAAYLGVLAFDRFGIDPYLSAILIMPLFFAIGIAYYWLLLRWIVGQSLLGQALLTIAVSFILEGAALGWFGSQPQIVNVPYSVASIGVGGLTLPVPRLVAGGVGLLATGVMYLLLWRTDLGIAVRASATDRPIAEAMGINTHWVQAVVTGMGIACAALGGAVLLPIYSASPEMGGDFTFLAFLIIVLGGLGNFFGALVGGILIGVTENLGATFFDGSIGHMLTFLLFVVLLIFRPNGVLVAVARR